MAFAGTLVASGRGSGLVVATATRTQVGSIAGELAAVEPEPPPLIRRMERFARVLGAGAIGLCAVLITLGIARGEPWSDVLLSAVALAVSAIPEGLPIALTVALAVAVSRMAKRRVVVRHLPAVEGLGSCGVIATDKTGTLTRNELTVERVAAGPLDCEVTGVGYAPEGALLRDGKPISRLTVTANSGTPHRSARAALPSASASPKPSRCAIISISRWVVWISP